MTKQKQRIFITLQLTAEFKGKDIILIGSYMTNVVTLTDFLLSSD